MVALTRIKNNQITDSTVNAAAKLQDYSVTAGKLANNITYGSDLTVSGNLTVNGQTTTIDTNVTTIEDPVILLASTQTGSPAVDIGFIGERGTSDNIAFVWDESATEFVTAFTSTGETNTTITISSYANFHTNNANIGGNIVINGTSTLTGNANVNGNLTVAASKTLIFGDNVLANVATPTLDTDAATKGYVDSQISGAGFDITDGVNTQTVDPGQTITFSGVANETTVVVSAVDTVTIGLPDNVVIAGSITGNSISSNTTISATGNVSGGNVTTGGRVDATGNVAGGNLTTGGQVAATGNITGGNLITAGLASVTGNITGGNLITAGLVNATGNVSGGNVTTTGIANIGTLAVTGAGTVGTTLGVTGNITGGNVTTTGIANIGTLEVTSTASVTGNITGGNLLTGGLINSTGNITGGNLITGGKVVATGNVTGGNITTGGDVTTVTVTASGNVTGGNLITGGLASVTGNITGGNLITGGLASVTGNITGGNINTGGQVTATGNISGGNLTAGSGLISTTGNINGGNVNTNNVVGTGLTLTSTGSLNLAPTGNISAGSAVINSVGTPVQDADAATKAYVDSVAQGLDVKASCYLATAAALPSYTYNNGTSGVGATITASANGALTVDGVAATANSRILVKNETSSNQPYNGIYVVTNAGSAGAAFVLTRATDFDSGSPSGEIPGAFTFIEHGSTQADTGWVCTTNAPVTVGTTNITFVQFSGAGSYAAGNALTLSGTTFNVNVDTSGANTVGINGSNELYIPAGAVLTTPNIGAATGTSVNVTGNVTGGNVTTTGIANIGTLAVTGAGTVVGNLTVTANISGGNISTTGITSTGSLSATGNITGGNVTTTGIANIGTLAVTGAGTVTGNLTVTANVSGGNLLTGGLVNATGNVTGGNLVTAGQVAATGNITGGNVTTTGIANIGTLAVTGAGTVGTTLGVTGNITGGNLLTGGLVNATGNVTGGNINTGGTVNATGNINGTGAVFSGNVTAANFIGNISGNIDAGGANTNIQFNDGDILNGSAAFTFDKTSNAVVATGNITGANITTAGKANIGTLEVTGTGSVTGNLTVTANIAGGNITTGGLINATGNVTGGNVVATALVTGANVSATSNVSGANVVGTTAVIGGNIVISGDNITDTNGRVNFNTAGADVDFAVNGDTVANVFYVDAGTGTVSFGSATQTTGALAAFNSDNSILLPVGNTGTRPGSGVTGMVRFNTTNNNLEVYDNSQWSAVGVPSFTVITNDSFAGDGTTVAFTLSESASTDSCIVSINGVVQIPTTAYSVSGTTLTFTEAPLTGDAIDVRILTTTTTVTSISNASGNAVVATLDTANTVQITGSLLPAANAAQSLGSATKQWSALHVAGNTIYLGDLQLKATSTTFTVYQSDGVTQANIDAGSIDVSSISSGTSVIGISGTNGNAYITVGGTANVIVASTTGANVTGTLGVTGNITGGNLSGTNIVGTLTTAAQNNITSVGTLSSLAVTGNITAGNVTGVANVNATTHTGTTVNVTGNITGSYFIGNGSTLSSLTGANITGTVANATYATSAGSATTAGTVTTAAQPNITSVGTLSSVTVTGNVTGGNLITSGDIFDTGALTINTAANGNITLAPNGTGVIVVNKDIVNGQANGVGNIGSSTTYFNTVFAKATSAQYADLAEKYVADAAYAPGTVVVFGGDKEVTVSSNDADRAVAGVVSTNPSYIMNGGLEAEFVATVALTGRVPCRVTGTVKKGDLMVSAGYGLARAEADPKVGTVIGKALENFEGNEGVIEVVVGRF